MRSGPVWHEGEVRHLENGPVEAVVAGVCRAGDAEVSRAAGEVAAGRYAAAQELPGAYWMVVHDSRRHRTVVAGSLAQTYGLFTAHTELGTVWATHAGLLVGQLGARPDLAFLAAQVVLGSGERWPERTVWEGIRRVPGGSALVLDVEGAHMVDIRPRPDGRTLAGGAAEVGEALWSATQDYARMAGETVSADLSGGLDSSTAVIAAAAVSQVCAVTYGGPFADAQDTELAARVAEYVGAEHHISRGGLGTTHFSVWPAATPWASVLQVSSYPLDTDYLPAARGISPVHLTGHGGDVVLESSSAAWTALVQDGQKKRARDGVQALARRVNTAPGRMWGAVKDAAKGRPRALAQAAEAVADGRLLNHGVGAWTWCPVGPAAQWLTRQGRDTVAALLAESAQAVGDVDAGVWNDWSALRYNGAAIRDSQPLFDEHGVNQVSPFLDNEVVRACLTIASGERRRTGAYKPLLAAARPDLPPWLLHRRSKGNFTPLVYEGMRANHQRLVEVIDASPLVAAGLIDPQPVREALTDTVVGAGRGSMPAIEGFVIASWWLQQVARASVGVTR